MRFLIVLLLLAGCGAPAGPEAFGVTMVEETTCIGLGGRIVTGPDGAVCRGADG
ncbi:hypothetical protein [Pseudooctadecabacter sp.]|uniref:hypothetical protein n=1 Tax=Pseudooctadecabacter sp. TaxID=1966338 RepID=UPI0025ED1305|nr:hypothetical protein [Pseudooctadecabacter sp.]